MAVAESLETFLQVLSAGFIIGCIYGLMCAGLGLIFGIMRVINFAQGEFMMLAMYAGLLLVGLLAPNAGSVPFVWAVVAAVLVGVLFYGLGVLVHALLVGRVSGTRLAGTADTGHTAQLILTLGISLVLQNGGLMAFGSTPTSIKTELSAKSWRVGPLWGQDIELFINQARGYSALLALAAVGGTLLLLRRTSIGRRLRAAADNPVAALYMGINVDATYRTAFGLGLALTGMAGVAIATFYPFQPYTGFDFVIIMYTGVVLGGMGSFTGAFLGGLIIGLVQQLSTLLLPSQLQNTAIFVIFLLILLMRPQGLFGRNVERA
jgi:branched-chain amino acid transport system permease protein